MNPVDDEAAVDAVPRVLPRGRHDLGDAVVRSSQRSRLLDAMVDLSAENSYMATSVADVLERSRISRKTFYEHFSNKEECFIAAYERGVSELQQEIAAAVLAASTWQDRFRAVCESFTDTLASNPAFARVFVIEVMTAGPEIRRRRDMAFDTFLDLYRELHRQAKEELPDVPELEESHSLAAVIGAVTELLRIAVNERGPEGIRELSEIFVRISWTVLKGLEDLPPAAPASRGGA
jgi:AcrR family transcriptional regulator